MSEPSHSSACSTQSCGNGDTTHLRLLSSSEKRCLSGASASLQKILPSFLHAGVVPGRLHIYSRLCCTQSLWGLRCVLASSDISRSLFKYYFLCVCKCLCGCVSCVRCMRKQGGGLELDLEVIVNHHLCAENHTCVLCKNRAIEPSPVS